MPACATPSPRATTHVPARSVLVQLVDGPFSMLDGTWQFQPLGRAGAAPSDDADRAPADRVRHCATRSPTGRSRRSEPGVRPDRQHLRRSLRAARRAGVWRALTMPTLRVEVVFSRARRTTCAVRAASCRRAPRSPMRCAPAALLERHGRRCGRRAAGRHLGPGRGARRALARRRPGRALPRACWWIRRRRGACATSATACARASRALKTRGSPPR